MAGRESSATKGRPPFGCIALLLQGGGALGSYQAGVYEALAKADLHPDWVAGISIGSINAALIAGNPPDDRVAKLRAFWIWPPDYPPSPAQATNLPRFLVLSQPDACEHDRPADPGTFDAAGDSAVNEQEQSQECCILVHADRDGDPDNVGNLRGQVEVVCPSLIVRSAAYNR